MARSSLSPDIGSFVSVVEAFYEASFNDDLWKPAMVRLGALMGGATGVFGTIEDRRLGLLLHSDCGPEYQATFFDPHMANPILPRLLRRGGPEVIADHALMSPEELHRTRFFNEWLRPQGDRSFAYLKVPVGRTTTVVVGLQRGGRSGQFSCDEVAILDRLAPVLERAARLRLRFGQACTGVEAQSWDRLGIGWLIVNASCRLLEMNATAEALFSRSGQGISLVGGRVSAATLNPADRLEALVASACRPPTASGVVGGDLLIWSTLNASPLLALTIAPFLGGPATCLPQARTAVILVHDLQTRTDAMSAPRLQALFRLTPKEAHLAVALAAGCSIQQHAADAGVSSETVRTHLQSLFAKTATSRQGELVALLNRTLGVPGRR